MRRISRDASHAQTERVCMGDIHIVVSRAAQGDTLDSRLLQAIEARTVQAIVYKHAHSTRAGSCDGSIGIEAKLVKFPRDVLVAVCAQEILAIERLGVEERDLDWCGHGLTIQ